MHPSGRGTFHRPRTGSITGAHVPNDVVGTLASMQSLFSLRDSGSIQLQPMTPPAYGGPSLSHEPVSSPLGPLAGGPHAGGTPLSMAPGATSLSLPQHAPPQMPARFVLVKQTGSSEENTARKGDQKKVYVVVKEETFTMEIGLQSPVPYPPVNLFTYSYDAVVVYDADVVAKAYGSNEAVLYQGYKELDASKSKPFEMKTTINPNSQVITAEVKLKVLTSHHDNSCFRIKFFASSNMNGLAVPPSMSVVSHPIRVISKVEQLRKSQSSRKRTLTEIMSDYIDRIEEQQQAQQALIEQLAEKAKTHSLQLKGDLPLDAGQLPAGAASAATAAGAANNLQNNNPHNSNNKNVNNNNIGNTNPLANSLDPQATTQAQGAPLSEFERRFVRFFKAYAALPSDEKPVKVRKLIRNSSANDTEKLCEFIDFFSNSSEGLQRTVGGDSKCGCSTCPFQKELERIDGFYKDFFTNPVFGEEGMANDGLGGNLGGNLLDPSMGMGLGMGDGGMGLGL
eukprot:TRINITY_DN5209_c0_g1_i2.p1 TRINITY_DN5209_c0_g1~~TRINITY_DN5209_c0_g1_i2.p1  ORF type:complete len:532 (-),score=117.96 TRINITY_DN5209_c0_g1_i2:74-1600(-)